MKTHFWWWNRTIQRQTYRITTKAKPSVCFETNVYGARSWFLIFEYSIITRNATIKKEKRHFDSCMRRPTTCSSLIGWSIFVQYSKYFFPFYNHSLSPNATQFLQWLLTAKHQMEGAERTETERGSPFTNHHCHAW